LARKWKGRGFQGVTSGGLKGELLKELLGIKVGETKCLRRAVAGGVTYHHLITVRGRKGKKTLSGAALRFKYGGKQKGSLARREGGVRNVAQRENAPTAEYWNGKLWDSKGGSQ